MLTWRRNRGQSFLGARGWLIRGTSFAFVAFLLLASGRAFVPGMCATQAALLRAAEDHHPASASWRSKECCSMLSHGQAEEAPAAPTSGTPVCAFCNLAHAILDEPVQVVLEQPPVLYNDAIPVVETLLLSRDVDPGIRGRAPPVSFA